MTTDQQIEAEIQAKGLTAPRITPTDVEANIIGEAYFTGEQGRAAAVAPDGSTPERGYFSRPGQHSPLSLLTFCVLVLKNGFTVTGTSACASPENFDAEIGRKVARQDAVRQVWPLMGYQLREQLYQMQQPAQAPVAATFADRVRAEKVALDENLTKLRAFFERIAAF
jgi:hypothetical protein